MNPHIENIRQRIGSLREEIVHHPVYSVIRDVDDLKIFMQYHVYAVWDFMSLLKTLQNALTCVSVPWFPVGTADTRFLINEIVTGEEADVDQQGKRKSHFELYLEAMQQCGADRSPIESFIHQLKETGDLDQSFTHSGTPAEAAEFVRYTFEIINSGKAWVQSAVFTFGREDLIPGMFLSLINDIQKKFPDSISIFKYYLERHIEVDGDHHSHLALEMTAHLCGEKEEYWREAEEATIRSLQMRKLLWDGVYNQLIKRRHPASGSVNA